jgi:hypothetical protein
VFSGTDYRETQGQANCHYDSDYDLFHLHTSHVLGYSLSILKSKMQASLLYAVNSGNYANTALSGKERLLQNEAAPERTIT